MLNDARMGRGTLIEFYKNLLKKGVINENGFAHKRLKYLQNFNGSESDYQFKKLLKKSEIGQ